MPRAIWTGAVSFGLVNVPVRMYSAVDEHDLHFHYVHEKDGSRIGYEKICKLEQEPVADDEIVKAYEVEDGEYVYMSDEDFAAAEVEAFRTIQLRDFVPYEQIDPIYFERTYYLGPQEGSERVYAMLVRAMEDSELAGLGTFVMRDKQHLAALRVRDGTLTLERMYFADEVRPAADVAPDGVDVDERELDMARRLIEAFAGSFEPEQYHDTYRERLLDVIEQKRKGEQVHAEPAAEPEQPTDIMAALRASLDAVKGRRGAPAGADGAKRDGALEDLTKDELLARARKAGVPGRSRMSKDELVDALAA